MKQNPKDTILGAQPGYFQKSVNVCKPLCFVVVLAVILKLWCAKQEGIRICKENDLCEIEKANFLNINNITNNPCCRELQNVVSRVATNPTTNRFSYQYPCHSRFSDPF